MAGATQGVSFHPDANQVIGFEHLKGLGFGQ
jgi:hypothetical protein